MLSVLETTRQVLKQIKHVNISKKAITTFVDTIDKDDLQSSDINLSKYNWEKDQLIELTFLFNTINFCFWTIPGEVKWTIVDDNLDGAVALFRCLENGLKKSPDMLNPRHLANMQLGTLRDILEGNIVIPLISERLFNINNFGQIIKKRFKSSIRCLVEEADYDAYTLAELLVDNFECFNDTSSYRDYNVSFYKRAQLNSKMIHDVLISIGENGLKNLNKLTAFADYKVPQILRNIGILIYSEELSQKIDNYELIERDSEYENEIRISTIWATEYIVQKLKAKYTNITSAHVDNILWLRSQIKKETDKPYHRVFTTAY